MLKNEISILIGTGVIGLAILKEVYEGRNILLADLNEENAKEAARKFDNKVYTKSVDITSRDSVIKLCTYAQTLGSISQIIIATGVSPSRVPSDVVFKVDLLGVALTLEVFGKVIAADGAGLVIGSQAGHRMKALSTEDSELIAKTPADQLLDLPIFHQDQYNNSLYAYQLAKRASSLRVKYEAVRWGMRQARVNIISPGIVMTPLSEEELKNENADQYRKMINECPAKRVAKPEEIAALAKVIMGKNGGFITGSDFLIDGGVTASYYFGNLNSII